MLRQESAELRQARQLYRSGRLSQAATLAGFCLRRNPDDADAMQLLGTIQYQSGQADAGRALVERSLAIDPTNPEAWNNLGLMRHLSGDDDGALEAFAKATEASPAHGEAWMNLGFVLLEAKRPAEAVSGLEQAIAVGFDGPQVRFFLGNGLAEIGRHEEAVAEFDRALAADPKFSDAWNNRGNSLSASGRPEEAVVSFQKAIAAAPQNPLPYSNLATTLHRLGESEQALSILEECLRVSPNVVELCQVKADILVDQERLDEALTVFGGLHALRPDDVGVQKGLARVSMHQGLWRRSIDLLAGVESASARILRAVALPVILGSREEVDESRAHLKSEMEALASAEESPDDPLAEIGQTTFHLAYHGIGERDLQGLVAKTYRHLYPSLRFEAGHTPSRGDRIRVGFLSSYLHSHTIGKLFASLIERLDRERFEVVYLQLGKIDAVSQRLANSVDRHVLLPRTLAESRRAVAAEECDILFYPDIGMDAHSYYLAFSRLAPVQCVMWGHPMTTGSPEMDYFVSSKHLERPDGDSEYTEKLVRLPSLTTYFHRPPTPAKLSRADFGLEETAKLYACPQTLFKIHPDFDRVLAAILDRDEQGRLVMIASKIGSWQRLLTERWRRTYPVIAERVVFLPGMKLERFLALAAMSDAVLDPIQFGGGNSSMEFFASGAPVVTLPQGLLRNRITYAAYKQVGFEDMIARSEEEYVDLALRLANDSDWQHEMRRQVVERSAALFENQAAVEELSDFLASVRPA
ncbi:MAG TPA: tetratricopeptide repeat protein [Fimbriimonadaceae bacterium]|nr:tetratricopeptide repeat protein [Fimbriimonadaceae bacterium]